MTYELRKDDAPLTPGIYYFYFDSPEWVKRQIAARPNWAQEAARRITQQSGAQVRFLGSGLTHLPLKDGQRTLYGVTVEVLESGGELGTQSAGVLTAFVLLAAIGAAVYITERWVGYMSANEEVVKDLGDAVQDFGESLDLFAWAGILFGGAALVYAVSRFR